MLVGIGGSKLPLDPSSAAGQSRTAPRLALAFTRTTAGRTSGAGLRAQGFSGAEPSAEGATPVTMGVASVSRLSNAGGPIEPLMFEHAATTSGTRHAEQASHDARMTSLSDEGPFIVARFTQHFPVFSRALAKRHE